MKGKKKGVTEKQWQIGGGGDFLSRNGQKYFLPNFWAHQYNKKGKKVQQFEKLSKISPPQIEF